ncbi:glutamine amidotransferase [Schlesneria paludicola]|uniref:glutamine amidotransferase n=1 Tax=Schlesneria paludicola TaxID=360056 RepID=UPI00029AF133|nr:glutamine amidotransferase [Schlesneria paludicola]
MWDKLIFGSQSFLAWAVTLFVCGLVLVVWRYRRSRTDWLIGWLAPALKVCGLLLLSFCLLDPLWSGQRARPGANLFLILADDSQSMTMKDPGASASRGELYKHELTAEESGWQVRLAQDFDLRKYTFDSRLQNAVDYSALRYQGTQSNLIGVLNGLKERFRDRPVAGVLLFSDGNATDASRTEFQPDGLPPVYPVVLHRNLGEKRPADLSISHLAVTTTSFEDAPVTIQADVTQSALPQARVTAQVLDESGKVVKEETQAFSNDRGPIPFRFQIRPTKPGVSFYEVRVRTQDEATRADSAGQDAGAPSNVLDSTEGAADPSSVEATLANNRRRLAIDRGTSKYRILYLMGRPNWEYKFLRRAVESDEQIQLTAVIRIAKKEPKFDWRQSRGGEVSNPLFRGFDGKTEETERYDQPVLVRLNTKTPDELRDGFPKLPDELFEFHAVIIDDLEAEFFSPDQLALLERFVSERGGGLLMLGGTESFRQGGYERTPIGRMLPLYLDGAISSVASPTYRWNLTRDGWLQPWARLRSTETEEQQRLAEMPNFLAVNRLGQLKPGATVVAEVVTPTDEKLPALAVQTFGRGRCAVAPIADFWRWQLDRTDAQRAKDDLGKAWRQTLRWLIADVPGRIEIRTEPKDEFGQPLMRIEARVRSKDYLPQDNAALTVSLKLPDGTIVSQPAEPSLREAGLYESTFAARHAGGYRATVEVVDRDGQVLGREESGWVSDPAADEFRQIVPNLSFLEQVARQTSGDVIALNDLDEFVRTLPNRRAPLTEVFTTPIWHQPWMLILIVGCLCSEWALRRWKGLP